MSAWMPIMGTPFAIKMELLDEWQAKINHSQSLQTLASRGGLDAREALAIVKRKSWAEADPIVEKSIILSMIMSSL